VDLLDVTGWQSTHGQYRAHTDELYFVLIYLFCGSLGCYRVAKLHRMPYLCRLFSARALSALSLVALLWKDICIYSTAAGAGWMKAAYRVAKMHCMPDHHRSFSAEEPYN